MLRRPWPAKSLIPSMLAACIFASLLLTPAPLYARSFLRKLGTVLKYYHETNQVLWLLGDPAAERRFGYAMSRLMMLMHPLDKNRERNAWVQKIFRRVVEPGRRKSFQYRVYIVRDRTINAFALPGGYVFVNRGMLDFIHSDDELATILGHELAHVNRRHALQRLRKSILFLELVKKLLDDKSSVETAAKIGFIFENFRFSRQNEREADRLGMTYARDAGYDPSGMATLWERMLDKYGDHRTLLEKRFATHPGHTERVGNAKKLLVKWELPYHRTNFLTVDMRAAQPDDLLLNGSFEDPSVTTEPPDGWELIENVQRSSALYRTGQYSMHCFNDDPTSYCCFRSAPYAFDPKKTYVVSGAVQSQRTGTAVWLGMEFYGTEHAPLGTVYCAASNATVPVGGWRSFTGTIGPSLDTERRAPEGAISCAVVAFACRYKVGECWFDDVFLGEETGEITNVDEGAEPVSRHVAQVNILPNPDFEVDEHQRGKPDQWVCSQGASRSTELVCRGESALCFEGQRRGRKEFAISNYVPVTPGARYVLEARVRVKTTERVIFGYRIFTSDRALLPRHSVLEQYSLTRRNWTPLEHRITIPEDDNPAFLQVWFRTAPKVGHKIFVDDCSLIGVGH